MTDLDARLRRLADRPTPAPSTPDDLRRRAAARRVRRARTSWAVSGLVLIMVASLIGWQSTTQDEELTATVPGTSTSSSPSGVTPTATRPRAAGTRTLGDVVGIDLQVEPASDLTDGQVVRVRVTGLSNLPGAVLAICTEYADQTTAMLGACDPGAINTPGASGSGQVTATNDQEVTVRRVLAASTATESDSYDCASRPCYLAVGSTMGSGGVRGVLVPIVFRPTPLPPPRLALDRTTNLRGGEVVGFTATGLTPDASYDVRMCRAETYEGSSHSECDSIGHNSTQGPPLTDASGTVRGTIAAWAGIYSGLGRIDCTRDPCAATLVSRDGRPPVQVSFSFAPDVVAWTPQLRIVEPAPYRHGQTITLRGSGFRPGLDVRQQIGLCPADKDTSVEERCIYQPTPAVVADDGTFTKEVTLPSYGCNLGPGCHLGWVIPKGVTLGAVRVPFVTPGG